MKRHWLKKTLVLWITMCFFFPILSANAATITLNIEESITIGTPFRVYVKGLKEGAKIKLMIDGYYPPPDHHDRLTWVMEAGSNGKIDKELKIPIGSKINGWCGNLKVSFRYYDPDLKKWLQPTKSVFTSIEYKDVWIEYNMPTRRSHILEMLSGEASPGNSTNIINHLSELYALENLVKNRNLQWKYMHKVRR
jgi:hypothetical protein